MPSMWWSFCNTHSRARTRVFSIAYFSGLGLIVATAAIMLFRRLSRVAGLFLDTWDFRKLQRKKSGTERSEERESQLTSPFFEISRPGNFCLNKERVSFAVWHVAPSCWNQVLRKEEVLQHHSVAITIDSHGITLLTLEEVGTNDALRWDCAPNSDPFTVERSFKKRMWIFHGPKANVRLVDTSW